MSDTVGAVLAGHVVPGTPGDRPLLVCDDDVLTHGQAEDRSACVTADPDDIPMTATGKVDKRARRALLEEPT
jgi:hypothetical protein